MSDEGIADDDGGAMAAALAWPGRHHHNDPHRPEACPRCIVFGPDHDAVDPTGASS